MLYTFYVCAWRTPKLRIMGKFSLYGTCLFFLVIETLHAKMFRGRSTMDVKCYREKWVTTIVVYS